MRVAIATCRPLPEPDPDEAPLLAALAARGAEAVMCPWHEDADWGSFDACVVRSTWDYYRDPSAFLAWAERVAAVTALRNPLPVVRWNLHKAYLLELAGRGLPVAPTVFLRAGSRARLGEVVRAQGWERAVVKPAISAGSRETIRSDAEDLRAGEEHLARLLQREDMLVQGYLESVETSGERSLVFVDGELSHAIRKSPRFGSDDESVSGPLPVADDERALAERVMALCGEGLLYARVDLARDADGQPCLMELELLEPSLFLLQHPPALERLADAIARLG